MSQINAIEFEAKAVIKSVLTLRALQDLLSAQLPFVTQIVLDQLK